VEAMPELFVETVWAMAKATVMPPFAEFFKVVAAQLGDDASVLGAAAWAAECLGSGRQAGS
jgi:glucokinase